MFSLVRVLDNGGSTSREPWETTQTAETSDSPEKYNIVAETINGIERQNPATQSRKLLSGWVNQIFTMIILCPCPTGFFLVFKGHNVHLKSETLLQPFAGQGIRKVIIS